MGGITCLSPDPRGGMWLGDSRRLVHWEKGRFVPFAPPAGAPAERILCVTDDTAGRLWLGYPGARLGLLEGESFRVFPPETFGAGATAIIRVSENTRTARSG